MKGTKRANQEDGVNELRLGPLVAAVRHDDMLGDAEI